MGIVNSNQSYSGLVQKYIGSAYDNVKIVADNIQHVVTVANLSDLADIASIAQGILNDRLLAQQAASDASTSEQNAKTSEINAKASEDNVILLESKVEANRSSVDQTKLDIQGMVTDVATHRAVTDANVQITNADVVTTNNNVQITNDNAAKTNADALATAADAAQTAQDVITTNNNVAITNADVATTNANAAKTAADAAQTAQDAAATSANATQTTSDVLTTQNNVNITNTNVQITEDNVRITNNDVSITNSNVAQTTLNAQATAQDVQTTNANVAITNADVVTTNNNVSYIENRAFIFDKQYLGTFPNDPTTDNNGDPLQEGALYVKTSVNPPIMRFYANGAWGDAYINTVTQNHGSLSGLEGDDHVQYLNDARHSAITGNPHNTTPADIGLDLVDNTADLDKPVSTATQAVLNTKADKLTTANPNDNVVFDANGNIIVDPAMDLPAVEPTLKLPFDRWTDPKSGTIDLPPNVKFENAGWSTTVNQEGRVVDVPPNTPRGLYKDGVCEGILIEGQETNLIDSPRDFTRWNFYGIGTGVPPKILSINEEAPDGSLSATRILFDKGAGTTLNDSSNIQLNIPTIAGQEITQSIFIKSADDNNYDVSFSFHGQNSKLFTVTPKWQRIENSAVAIDTVRGFRLILRGTYGTSDKADVLLWHAQREHNTRVSSSIIPDATQFNSRASTKWVYGSDGNLKEIAVDEAPWSYNPNDLTAPPRLLIEESRTNEWIWSIDATQWAQGNVTASDSGLSTYFGNTLYKITTIDSSISGTGLNNFNSINGVQYTGYVNIKWGNTDTVYILTKWFRSEGWQGLQLDQNGGIFGKGRYIDLLNFVKHDNGTVTITFTFIANQDYTGAGVEFRCFNQSATYTAGDYFYIGDVQLEQGTYPTSYIPTNGSAVTRSADIVTPMAATRLADKCWIDGKDFTDFYNQSEGTWVAKLFTESNYVTFFTITDGTYANRVQILSTSLGESRVYIRKDNILISDSITTNQLKDGILAIRQSDVEYSVYFNSINIDQKSINALNTNLDKVFIGADPGWYQQPNGVIKYLYYYSKALTDAELKALTTE